MIPIPSQNDPITIPTQSYQTPLQLSKKKTMQEMLQERDKQRKKQKAQLYMETTRHQIEK